MPKFPRAARGFTLIEIMATVGIVGGLTAAALPLAHAMRADRDQAALNSALAASIETARARALAEGQSVSLCASLDGERCGAGGWSDGWRLYRGDTTLASYRPARSLPLEVRDASGEEAGEIAFTAQGFTLGDRGYVIETCAAGKPLAVELGRSGRLVRVAGSHSVNINCEG